MITLYYILILFMHIIVNFNFRIKLNEILIYIFVLMCMFKTYNLLFICRLDFNLQHIT
jgi:hypothetical protein